MCHGIRDQIANICWIIEKAREFQKKSTSALLTMQNLWLCGSQQTVENSSRGENTRPPYLPLEESVCRSRSKNWNRTWNNGLIPNWERSMSSLYIITCLFNLHAQHIMANASLDEAQAGIKIAGRNNNNLRYADDTTLMAKREEELKSLLMNMKVEGEKVGLKLNIHKTKIMASGPITSWEIDGETVETVSDFIFWGSKIKSLTVSIFSLGCWQFDIWFLCLF